MNKNRFALNILTGLIMALACSSLAHAQATRTWVSGVGDDANPCSRTAPCKTFAGAISKTAPAGEIDAIDSGGFGTLTITKSITIDGQGVLASVLSAGTNGFNINILNTDKVVLRNISINGAGTGINGINWFNAGGSLVIENCTISRVTNSLVNANLTNSGNLTINNLAGTYSGPGTANVDAGIRMTTSAGILKASITDTHLQDNNIGINIQDNVQATIRNTTIEGNGGTDIGVRVATVAAAAVDVVHLEGVTISNLAEGVRVTTAGGANKVFLSNCNIFNCTNSGTNAAGGVTVTSFINNRFSNNTADQSGPFTTKGQQ
ncbi:MAG TPA: hypothetical protein VGO91_06265 [Pyrinomonadaceae bacterium]|jgi:hypothetical protein|nr:hypothetical protein [Pyrinomonadaceae bacterium]